MNSDKPQITFAIPYYKGKSFLYSAIRSVIDQNLTDWNLIIIDDSSGADNVEDLVREFKDTRISYLKNPKNLGMAETWNRCIHEAKTELVTILHNDDVVLPNYAVEMIAAHKKFSEASAYFCDTKIICKDGIERFSFPDLIKKFIHKNQNPLSKISGEDGLTKLLKGNFIFCPSICYNKSKLNGLKFNSNWKMVLDLEFTTSLLLNDSYLIGLPVVAFNYRRHGENASAIYTTSMLRFKEEIALYDELLDRIRAKNWVRAEEVALKKRIIKLGLIYSATSDLAKFKFSNFKKKAIFLRSLLGAKFKSKSDQHI